MTAAAWALAGAIIGAVCAPPEARLQGAAAGALVGAASHLAAKNPAVARRVLDAEAKVVA